MFVFFFFLLNPIQNRDLRDWNKIVGKSLLKETSQSLTRVSISRKSREEMSQFFLSRAGEMIFHFSFSSRFSRSQEKNSLSLLDLWDFIELFSFTSRFSRLWRKISLSPLDLWDFIELFSFTSRFSRLWRKISPFTLDCQDCVVPVSLSLPVGNGLF